MKNHRNATIVFAILAFVFVFLTNASLKPVAAQNRPQGPFIIAPYPHHGPCSLFLVNEVVGILRVDFYHYAAPGKSDGATDEENPARTELRLNIVSNAGPTESVANIIDSGDHGQPIWELRLTEKVYNENRACLSGIAGAPAK